MIRRPPQSPSSFSDGRPAEEGFAFPAAPSQEHQSLGSGGFPAENARLVVPFTFGSCSRAHIFPSVFAKAL